MCVNGASILECGGAVTVADTSFGHGRGTGAPARPCARACVYAHLYIHLHIHVPARREGVAQAIELHVL